MSHRPPRSSDEKAMVMVAGNVFGLFGGMRNHKITDINSILGPIPPNATKQDIEKHLYQNPQYKNALVWQDRQGNWKVMTAGIKSRVPAHAGQEEHAINACRNEFQGFQDQAYLNGMLKAYCEHLDYNIRDANPHAPHDTMNTIARLQASESLTPNEEAAFQATVAPALPTITDRPFIPEPIPGTSVHLGFACAPQCGPGFGTATRIAQENLTPQEFGSRIQRTYNALNTQANAMGITSMVPTRVGGNLYAGGDPNKINAARTAYQYAGYSPPSQNIGIDVQRLSRDQRFVRHSPNVYVQNMAQAFRTNNPPGTRLGMRNTGTFQDVVYGVSGKNGGFYINATDKRSGQRVNIYVSPQGHIKGDPRLATQAIQEVRAAIAQGVPQQKLAPRIGYYQQPQPLRYQRANRSINPTPLVSTAQQFCQNHKRGQKFSIGNITYGKSGKSRGFYLQGIDKYGKKINVHINPHSGEIRENGVPVKESQYAQWAIATLNAQQQRGVRPIALIRGHHQVQLPVRQHPQQQPVYRQQQYRAPQQRQYREYQQQHPAHQNPVRRYQLFDQTEVAASSARPPPTPRGQAGRGHGSSYSQGG